MHLTKRIPTAAGLGGGSSDAAAAASGCQPRLETQPLSPLAELIGLGGSAWQRRSVFSSSGFLNGAAICRGRGEQIEPVDGFVGLTLWSFVHPRDFPLRRFTAIAVFPIATKPVNHVQSALVQALQRGDLSGGGELFFNRLQFAAEKLSGWIKRLRDLFSAQACLGHAMSGSGTSYFGLVATAAQARRLAGRLRSNGVGSAFYVRTC